MLNIHNTTYPTPEVIMGSTIDFRTDTLKAVRKWKAEKFDHGIWEGIREDRGPWAKASNDEKLERLDHLVYTLCQIYNVPIYVERWGNMYKYNPGRGEITLNMEHPSIISTLHEIRHAINGADETSACRWSVQLFQQCFPKQFAKLEFKPGSHLLVKKPV